MKRAVSRRASVQFWPSLLELIVVSCAEKRSSSASGCIVLFIFLDGPAGDVGWSNLAAAGINDLHELVGMFFTKHCRQEEFAQWLISEEVVVKGELGERRAFECARALHVKFTSI